MLHNTMGHLAIAAYLLLYPVCFVIAVRHLSGRVILHNGSQRSHD